ncbi:MAG TPA: DivIVA domain-containing protein [Cyclobacteriaceae bacterium]|nr:DivIVA domain-containing protein [Cyclobacteriaceae bacterium]
MKITPLEIRQKAFEKNFRGYNQDEVNAFLQTLSQEWERVGDENKELRIKLEACEREVLKLREVESSLFKTLKTAEDTGANVIEQARQAADLNMRESQLKADAMLNEAKVKARNTIEEAGAKSKQTLVEMEDRLKAMVENYKKLESTRDELLLELKRISQDTIERVERIKSAQKSFDADQHVTQAKKDIKKTISPNVEYKPEPGPVAAPAPVPVPNIAEAAEELVVAQSMLEEVSSKKATKSFFDEIG